MEPEDIITPDSSEADLLRVRGNVHEVLDALDLRELVSDKEIDEAVIEVDTIYEHPLILGVIMRITQKREEKLLGKWLSGLSAWKNSTVHPDLDGHSPYTYAHKYPTGPEERRLLEELMHSFQERLSVEVAMGRAPAGAEIPRYFEKFQKDFFALAPLVNPFPEIGSKPLSNKDVIVEERRRAGAPSAKLKDIGMKIPSAAGPEGLGELVAKLEDEYSTCTKDAEALHKRSHKVDHKKLEKIRKRMLALEPYMKSHEANWTFYANIGYMEYYLLDWPAAEKHLAIAIKLNPENKQPHEMLAHIKKELATEANGKKPPPLAGSPAFGLDPGESGGRPTA